MSIAADSEISEDARKKRAREERCIVFPRIRSAAIISARRFLVLYKRKGDLTSPFVASIVFDPRVVTSWSPSNRGTIEYNVPLSGHFLGDRLRLYKLKQIIGAACL